MSPPNHSSRRIRAEALRVDPRACPGWEPGADRRFSPGDRVFCAEGIAEVVRVLGWTGAGLRLLELRLTDQAAPPFFAASSNVLVPPDHAERAPAPPSTPAPAAGL
jgi:hypothetical protein